MKKLIAAILVLLIVGPLPFLTLCIQWEKKQVRREVKERLIQDVDLNQLKRLKFTNQQVQQELEWEHSKEFEYKGEMYDVVKKEYVEGGVIFWCWEDKEETALKKQLDELTKIAWDEKNPENTKNQVLDWLVKIFNDQDQFGFESSDTFSKRLFDYNRNTREVSLLPETPPPNII